MMRQYELVERVKAYEPHANEAILDRAYVFSMQAHGKQKRASGDPYFSHPVEVAGLLSSKRMDSATIITGLLHDTVEDTKVTVQDIQQNFGDEIARLVDGVTKLSQLERPAKTDESKQAENFRKFFLATSKDIRVLIIKLADRLHNMRTIHYIKREEKRRRIARETMDIYVPLAERVGIVDWKEELEDISFSQLNPDARSSIIKRLSDITTREENITQQVQDALEQLALDCGIKFIISGRKKSPYSIWRKTQRHKVGVEHLSDIMAFRFIVEDVETCYKVLGLIHRNYAAVPGRFKDYISLPKPNGYSSLHTTVIGPKQNRIEVQVRSNDMHKIAEFGPAAHWKYKSARSNEVNVEGKQYRWVNSVLEILANASGPEEFLEHTKMEMFADHIFVFTPRGRLIDLPRGATALDFAYAVHSEVGDSCVGALVNGGVVPLWHPLRNGDQVLINRSDKQKPSESWKNYVVTGKAKAAIGRFVRHERRENMISSGIEILRRYFHAHDYQYTEKGLKLALNKLKYANLDDMLAVIGDENNTQITAQDILYAVYPNAKDEANNHSLPIAGGRSNLSANSLPIKGLPLRGAVDFGKCCHPIPGDRIVGIGNIENAITIHTIDCPKLENFNHTPENWHDLSWDMGEREDRSFVGQINVVVINVPGSLGTITSAIGRSRSNIRNIDFLVREQDFFKMLIDVEVTDLKQFSGMIAGLRALQEVQSVERAYH